MPQRQEPASGLWHSWPFGYTPWDVENDRNWRTTGLFINTLINEFSIDDVPQNPSVGDTYIVSSNASDNTTTNAEWNDIVAANSFWLDDTSLSTINNKLIQWVNIPREEDDEFPEQDGEQWEIYDPSDGLTVWHQSSDTTYRFFNGSWTDITDNFLALTDTPSDYSGSDGQFLKVSGSSVTFDDLARGFTDLDDTPTDYSGASEGDFVVVNSSTDGVEFGSLTGDLKVDVYSGGSSVVDDVNVIDFIGSLVASADGSTAKVDLDNLSGFTSDDLSEGSTNRYRHQHTETFSVGPDAGDDVTVGTEYNVQHDLNTQNLNIDYYRVDDVDSTILHHLSGADTAYLDGDNQLKVAFTTDATYKIVLSGSS